MKGFVFYLDKLGLYTLYALMLFPILPRGLESVLMICFSSLSILAWYLERKRKSISLKDFLLIGLFSSVFLCYLLSLIYSSDFQEGVKQVIRVLPLALFPFIFGFLRKDVYVPKEMNRLTNIYLIALSLGLLLVNIVFFDNLYFSDSSHWEIRQGFEKFTNVHGTYMSIWLGFGVLILISKMLEKLKLNDIKKGIPFLVLLCYFIYGQIIIGARMPLVITMVLIAGYIVFYFKVKKGILIGLLLITVSALFLIISKSDIMIRLVRAVSIEHSFPEGDYTKEFKNITSEDIRKGIYFCSWNSFEEAPLTGHGIGDVQEKLQNCYEVELNSNVYQMFLYNSHNQYFQVALSAGVFALLLFVISLLIPLYISIKQSNYLWLGFTLFVIACFLTENVLSRHDGVIFYGLFNTILAYNTLKKE